MNVSSNKANALLFYYVIAQRFARGAIIRMAVLLGSKLRPSGTISVLKTLAFAKVQQKNDMTKFSCHFLAFFVFFSLKRVVAPCGVGGGLRLV